MKKTKQLIVEGRAGFPEFMLAESKEIEIPFEHRGKKAVAVFDVSGGVRVVARSYFGPAEYTDIEAVLIGATYEDGGEIPVEEFASILPDLEDKAMDAYDPDLT